MYAITLRTLCGAEQVLYLHERPRVIELPLAPRAADHYVPRDRIEVRDTLAYRAFELHDRTGANSYIYLETK